MDFTTSILTWYSQNKRDLPWRDIKNPYFIWLSEIILQQTRVEQGLPYYLKFIEKFPTVHSLAEASEDQVLKLWQGLGYYSRARNLHFAAKQIVTNFHGEFPNTYNEIISLKGIGEYTASAISSFAFGLQQPVLDGNVYRVLSRYFGLETPIDSSQGKKLFNSIAKDNLSIKQPADYNQAIMDFGALQCTPINPNCLNCLLQDSCYASRNNQVKILPVKLQKLKQKHRYFNYLVIKNNSSIFINKRTENDIWKNLYDFPLIETEENKPFQELQRTEVWRTKFSGSELEINPLLREYKHVLSHQKIFARFILINLTKTSRATSSYLKSFHKIRIADIKKYAIPKLIDNFLIHQHP